MKGSLSFLNAASDVTYYISVLRLLGNTTLSFTMGSVICMRLGDGNVVETIREGIEGVALDADFQHAFNNPKN